ncbi:hypothetical protein ACFXCZ_01440 [Streptomyces sp. NPDC059396]|uniref:hypothetical protein n=1 Tax=Streptomyces sp. NPDC059396 TaxID=3346819 RepID=UPI0036AEB866
MATVYVIVSNSHAARVRWDSIEVGVPVGDNAGGLTPNPAAIKATVATDYPLVGVEPRPTVTWDGTNSVFRVSAPAGAPPTLTLPAGGSLVLTLEDIPVSGVEGLVRLKLHETAGGGDGNVAIRDHTTTQGLLKKAPKIPRNFRPEKSMVDADAGENVALLWDGPDNLTYWIRDPQGTEVLVPRGNQGTYRWAPSSAPKRGTTYTLVARTAPGQQQGYFLTTTVHIRNPEFETLTATTGIHTPWIEGTADKGRVTFSAAGAEIRDQAGGWGTVAADRADLNGVNTKWVQGRDTGDGWIEFPKSGVNVFQDGKREWGTVAAEKADVNSVRTKWVWGRNDTDGWIEFPETGLNVFHGDQREWGTVAAAKADLNDLTVAGEVVAGDLTAKGKLTTKHATFGLIVEKDSLFKGVVNANAHLTVRNKDVGWVLKTNDDRVVVNDNFHVMGMISCRSREWEQH